MDLSAAAMNIKLDTMSNKAFAQHSEQPRTPAAFEGTRTHASTSPLRMSAGVLCLTSNDDWCSRSLTCY